MNEINCPKCKSKSVKYGKDGGIQKYKCKSKNCGRIFRENKNYNFKSKAEGIFFYTLLNLIKLEYLPFKEEDFGSDRLDFEKIKAETDADFWHYDISVELTSENFDELKELTPALKIYLKDNKIIVAKRIRDDRQYKEELFMRKKYTKIC
jgi:hypothetical protein